MKTDTAAHILDVAQDLVRCRGYSAFSYADIARQVGIRKASIHYHFPAKEDLGRELMARYRVGVQHRLHAMAQAEADPRQQLQQFVALYRDGLQDCQMCLCGILAAEIEVLPASVRQEVRAFLAAVQAWLAQVLARGQTAGDLHLRWEPATEAAQVLATVQGAQLLARAAEDRLAAFDAVAHPLLARLGGAAPPAEG